MFDTVPGQARRSGRLTKASAAYQAAAKSARIWAPYLPTYRNYNLTMSREARFLWFRVAKVGTRSVFGMLDQAGVRLDAEQAYFCRYAPGRFEDYFKFALVRNPWDRLVSGWKNKIVEANHFGLAEEERTRLCDFDAFIDWMADKDLNRFDHHFRLQTALIDLNNVDFVGRFEALDRDIAFIQERIGLPAIALPHRNATRTGADYRSHYSDSSWDRVGRMYEADISVFGYQSER